jgi:hypothetical protein
MKFITLTNANPNYRDHKIAIQLDSIVTVYELDVEREGATKPEKVTFLYCPPHGTWEVQESMKTVLEQLNKG